ncbi:low molecular weight protein-tyrosine-phosphatase [Sphingobium sp. Cam5-1]|uniref:low molecular weight protein-tyrosine-phosphatase n=1 Tax=Sphingobium sp. Cam5-1 TaxID=2789327 RepID=UPI0018AD156E|nr:low molecular weight protein-tyrosine-phosphatase [Sphingobium sp. Cam5-1]QPI75238.1 low molecular weight phosphotyrosine protein phosphatase [Sphingobium sp. Cam5-1]
MTISVLFVCLGNICRSPLAEAALRAEAERADLSMEIDSAGTGDWHVGSPPDKRAQAVALRNGIDISTYRGRQVTAQDFHRFDHIFALDGENLKNLRRIRPSDGTADLRLLMDLIPGREGTSVTDPYFGEDEGFDETWDDVTRAARALIKLLRD